MVLRLLDRDRMPRYHLHQVSVNAHAPEGFPRLIPTVLQANKAVIKTWIGKHSDHVPRWSITCEHSLRVKVEDTDIVLSVERYELVRTESKFLD
jgi:hypothetical protein